MTHCFRADETSTPLIEFSDLFTPFKPVVTHHLHAVRDEEFMGSTPFVEVNVVPICHLKTLKSVPEGEFVMSIHWHFRATCGNCVTSRKPNVRVHGYLAVASSLSVIEWVFRFAT